MLPDQHEHNYHYSGDNFAKALYEVISKSSGIPNPHETFKLQHTDMFTVEEMASNPVSMRFFEFLIAVSGIKRVLEIGAFIGVSTMNFARSVPDDGQVVSIEKFDHFAAIARKNFELNDSVTKSIFMRATLCVINRLPQEEKFDLILSMETRNAIRITS